MSSTTAIPLLGNNTAPGAYVFETDDSQYAQPLSNNIGAIAVVSDKGVPLPVQYTSPDDYVKYQGRPDFTKSLSNYSALRYLRGGFPLIARRVVDESYTNAMAIMDKVYGPIVINTVNNPNSEFLGAYTCGGNGTTLTPLEPINYEQGAKEVYSLSLATSPSTVTIDMTFTNNLTGSNPTVASPISLTPVSPAVVVTQAQVITAINTAIQAYATENDWNVQAVNDAAGNSHIYIIAPTGTTIAFSNLTGVTQDTTDYLFEVMAIGPGSYANYTLAYNIDSMGFGSPQIMQINLNAPLSGSTYTLSYEVNGVAYSVDVTISSSDTTVAEQTASIISQFIAEYNTDVSATYFSKNTAYDIYEAKSTTTSISVTNLLNAYNPSYKGNNSMIAFGYIGAPYQVTNITLTGTGSSAFSVSQVSTLKVPDFSFNFNVYQNGNSIPVESKKASFIPSLDHNGNQIQLDTVINNSLTGSKYVAVAINSAIIPSTVLEFYDIINDMAIMGLVTYTIPNGFVNFNLSTPLSYLVGGNNTVTPSNSQIAAAWSDFSDMDKVPSVGLLIQGGYTDAVVGAAIDAVASSRYDSFYCLDMPTDVQSSASSMIDFRSKILNIDSSKGNILGPDLKVNDQYSGQEIYEPPSGFLAVKTATNDFNVGPWQASAGKDFGTLSGVIDVRYKYNKTDRGLLNGAGINVIRPLKGGGITIYGAKTLLTTPSLLNYIPVRRMLTYCEIIILNYLEGRTFLNITPLMLNTTAGAVKQFLKTVKRAGGLADYRVNVGNSVNSTQYTDNGQANIQVIIMPYVPDQFAVLNAVITNGITFKEFTSN